MRTLPVPIPVGDSELPLPGVYFCGLALVGPASIQFGFDDEPYSALNITLVQSKRDGYQRIRFRNTGVAGTLTAVLSDGPISDTQISTLLAIAASLAAIDGDTDNLVTINDRLAGEAALTQKAKTNVAATGGAGTVVFAANANRKRISVTASEDNVGYIYLGKAGTVSAVDHFTVLFSGGNWSDDKYTGAVYAVGSDAAQNLVGYEL